MTAAGVESLVEFAGGTTGAWTVTSVTAVRGEPLPVVERPGVAPPSPAPARWRLQGRDSNLRYLTRVEQQRLAPLQAPLGRGAATRAALIPVRKSPAWWELAQLAQDERRELLEERSRHISIETTYAVTIARRLLHARDLGEPFDFLTWYEYAPQHAAAFEELVQRLRGTPEWSYVQRKVDIRLTSDSAPPGGSA